MAEPRSRRRPHHRHQEPIGAYSTLTALFGTGLLGLLAWSSARRRLPRRVSARDTVLIGIATHKLSRIIARERVTSALRAPFTEEEPEAGVAHVRPRGHGLRKALGELVTCPYCLAPWIAGGLLASYTINPPAARMVATLFTAVAVSDVANHVYLAVVKTEEHI